LAKLMEKKERNTLYSGLHDQENVPDNRTNRFRSVPRTKNRNLRAIKKGKQSLPPF
jgi:hypothetical protein